mmetsp:Transcript_29416/g.69958  ORF Transcript_29416/g.69958 Transcript_29416/m.69958 type:complete len:207 (-) Transcript_29416:8479-9099(-)
MVASAEIGRGNSGARTDTRSSPLLSTAARMVPSKVMSLPKSKTTVASAASAAQLKVDLHVADGKLPSATWMVGCFAASWTTGSDCGEWDARYGSPDALYANCVPTVSPPKTTEMLATPPRLSPDGFEAGVRTERMNLEQSANKQSSSAVPSPLSEVRSTTSSCVSVIVPSRPAVAISTEEMSEMLSMGSTYQIWNASVYWVSERPN